MKLLKSFTSKDFSKSLNDFFSNFVYYIVFAVPIILFYVVAITPSIRTDFLRSPFSVEVTVLELVLTILGLLILLVDFFMINMWKRKFGSEPNNFPKTVQIVLYIGTVITLVDFLYGFSQSIFIAVLSTIILILILWKDRTIEIEEQPSAEKFSPYAPMPSINESPIIESKNENITTDSSVAEAYSPDTEVDRKYNPYLGNDNFEKKEPKLSRLGMFFKKREKGIKTFEKITKILKPILGVLMTILVALSLGGIYEQVIEIILVVLSIASLVFLVIKFSPSEFLLKEKRIEIDFLIAFNLCFLVLISKTIGWVEPIIYQNIEVDAFQENWIHLAFTGIYMLSIPVIVSLISKPSVSLIVRTTIEEHEDQEDIKSLITRAKRTIFNFVQYLFVISIQVFILSSFSTIIFSISIIIVLITEQVVGLKKLKDRVSKVKDKVIQTLLESTKQTANRFLVYLISVDLIYLVGLSWINSNKDLLVFQLNNLVYGAIAVIVVILIMKFLSLFRKGKKFKITCIILDFIGTIIFTYLIYSDISSSSSILANILSNLRDLNILLLAGIYLISKIVYIGVVYFGFHEQVPKHIRRDMELVYNR